MSIAAATRRALAVPDALLSVEDPVGPQLPAVLAGIALAGTAAFAGALAVGLASSGPGMADVAAFLVAPPLALLLLFPPLYLLAVRRAGGVHPLRLATLCLSGHAAVGAVLGASAPIVLLYALTGDTGWDLVLMAVGLALLAGVAGARNAVRNARGAGRDSPGSLVLLAHYLLSTWTAAVLFFHLS